MSMKFVLIYDNFETNKQKKIKNTFCQMAAILPRPQNDNSAQVWWYPDLK